MKNAINKSTISQIGRVIIAVGAILIATGFLSMYDPNAIGANIGGGLLIMLGTAVAVAGVIIILAELLEKEIKKLAKNYKKSSKH